MYIAEFGRDIDRAETIDFVTWIHEDEVTEFFGFASTQSWVKYVSQRNFRTILNRGELGRWVCLDGIREVATRSDKPNARLVRERTGWERPENKRGTNPNSVAQLTRRKKSTFTGTRIV